MEKQCAVKLPEKKTISEPLDKIEVLLDPLLADVGVLLEEHKDMLSKQITFLLHNALDGKGGIGGTQNEENDQWTRNDAAAAAIVNIEVLRNEGQSQGTPFQEDGSKDNKPASAEEVVVPTSTSTSKKGSQMTLDEKDHHERQMASMVDKTHSTIFGMDEQERDSVSKVRAIAARIVEAKKFELSVAVLILLNSIFIGFEVELTKKDKLDEKKHSGFFVIQLFFCLSFTAELLTRLIADGLCRFFYSSPHLMWNYLDFVIVASSIIELCIHIVILASDGGGINTNMRTISNIRVMRILRLTRLLRAMRMARVVRFVRDLRLLVSSIVSTLSSLVWSMLLLLMIIYVFAIIFTEEAAETIAGDGNVDANVERFWGSLSESMFTLFKSISGGLDWDDPVIALRQISAYAVYLFTAFVAFVYFAVLNVVTGVFCTSAIESNLRDRENLVHAQIQQEKLWTKNMSDVFKSLDEDNSNCITIREFESGLKDSRMKAYLSSLELDPSDAWTLFKLLDNDKTQTIDLDEFVRGCLRLRGQARSIDMALLMYDTKQIAKRQEFFMAEIEMQLNNLTAKSGYLLRSLKREADISTATESHI